MGEEEEERRGEEDRWRLEVVIEDEKKRTGFGVKGGGGERGEEISQAIRRGTLVSTMRLDDPYLLG